MSHFAELNEDNIVLRVVCGNENSIYNDEGLQDIINVLGGRWMKTSYNAIGGKRRNPNTGEITNEPGFRKNYASVGFKYDADRDAFIPPKFYDSWILNEETCLWESPVPYPNDGNRYTWDEESINWILVEEI